MRVPLRWRHGYTRKPHKYGDPWRSSRETKTKKKKEEGEEEKLVSFKCLTPSQPVGLSQGERRGGAGGGGGRTCLPVIIILFTELNLFHWFQSNGSHLKC